MIKTKFMLVCITSSCIIMTEDITHCVTNTMSHERLKAFHFSTIGQKGWMRRMLVIYLMRKILWHHQQSVSSSGILTHRLGSSRLWSLITKSYVHLVQMFIIVRSVTKTVFSNSLSINIACVVKPTAFPRQTSHSVADVYICAMATQSDANNH